MTFPRHLGHCCRGSVLVSEFGGHDDTAAIMAGCRLMSACNIAGGISKMLAVTGWWLATFRSFETDYSELDPA